MRGNVTSAMEFNNSLVSAVRAGQRRDASADREGMINLLNIVSLIIRESGRAEGRADIRGEIVAAHARYSRIVRSIIRPSYESSGARSAAIVRWRRGFMRTLPAPFQVKWRY